MAGAPSDSEIFRFSLRGDVHLDACRSSLKLFRLPPQLEGFPQLHCSSGCAGDTIAESLMDRIVGRVSSVCLRV